MRTGNPKLLEWCEWLTDRIGERRAKLGHEPTPVAADAVRQHHASPQHND